MSKNYYTVSYNYIVGKIQNLSQDDIKGINALPIGYLYSIYILSNPWLLSYDTISNLNNYNIWKIKPIEFIDFVKEVSIKDGFSVVYPTFFKRVKQGLDKKLLKVYDKLKHKLGYDELNLFVSLSEQDEEYKNFLLDIDANKRNSKVTKKDLNKIIPKEELNVSITNDNVYYSKIPDKYYSDEWVLIDVRDHSKNFNEIILHFRNIKNNFRESIVVSKSKWDYFYIPTEKIASSILSPDKLKLIKNGSLKKNYNVIYDAISPKQKVITDYFYVKKKESYYQPKVLYFDIEVGSGKEFGALDTVNTPLPITYISLVTENRNICLILNGNKNNEVLYLQPLDVETECYYYNGNEKRMLTDFINMIYDIDPDIITSWNGFFYDYPYVYNRMTKLGLANLFTKHPRFNFPGKFTIESGKYSDARWTFYILTDMMNVYKSLQFSEKQSWTLDYISELELGSDNKKLTMPESNAPVEEWIAYNVQDSIVMKKIDHKVNGHNYIFMMMKLAKTYWEASLYSKGLITAFLASYAKENNIVLRTVDYNVVKKSTNSFFDSLVGGFNQSTTGGLFRWMVDYDASSMYPSLIRTFNIGPNTLRLTIHYKDALRILQGNYKSNEKIEVIVNEMDLINNKVEEWTISKLLKTIKKNRYYLLPSGGIFCNHEEEKSIYYVILTNLYNKRQYIRKNELKDKDGNVITAKHVEQLAIKIAMNSFFGVFGYKQFIFYNLTNANSITMSGRLFIKTIMMAIEDYYTHKKQNKKINITIDRIRKYIADPNFKITEQDTFMHHKYAIYADTDGAAICYEEFMPSENKASLAEQLENIQPLIKESEEIINKICYLDNQLLKFIDQDEYQFMTFKKEWITYKGLFYDKKKKRYILNVIKEDKSTGDIQLELSYTGVDIKRSEYPDLLKEKLKDLLRYLMQYSSSINMSEFFLKIDNVTKEFTLLLQNRKSDLCKIVNFSKDLSSYKNLPQHIDAMLLYNYLTGQEYFKHGVKGKIIYIKSIRYDLLPSNIDPNFISKKFRANSLAFPFDFEYVPDFVEIDINTMLKKVWIERYESIFEPIFLTVSEDESFDDFDFF